MPENVLDRLSDRQRECLRLVAQGYTSKEIGRMLGLSPSTIDNHIRLATERLGVTNRMAAARMVRDGNPARLSSDHRFPTFLPPLGGAPNGADTRRRFVYVVNVALFGTMAFAAITITIAGIVSLFSHR